MAYQYMPKIFDKPPPPPLQKKKPPTYLMYGP